MKCSSEVEPIKNVKDINKVKQYLYEKNNKRNYCIFVVGINVGLKAGDLLRLKIGDVTDGKMVFDEVSIKEQKTGKIKTFALNTSAKEAIQLYLDTLSWKGKNGYLFKSQKGGHLGVRSLHYIIKSAMSELNIEGNYGSHSLRKTMAYHQYINRVPLETIRKMLNLSSSDMTLRYIGIAKEVTIDYYNSVNL